MREAAWMLHGRSELEYLHRILPRTDLTAEGGIGSPQAVRCLIPFHNPPSQGDPLDGCERRILGGGLGEEGVHLNRISPVIHTQSECNAHHTKRDTRSYLFPNNLRKTMPLPRNLLAKIDSTVTKSVVNK